VAIGMTLNLEAHLLPEKPIRFLEATWHWKCLQYNLLFLTMQSNSFVVMFDHAFMEFPAQSLGEVDSLSQSGESHPFGH
jgi:hypothetical protein